MVILVGLDLALGVLILLAEVAPALIRALSPGIYPQLRPLMAIGGAYVVVLVVFAVMDFILAYGVWIGKGWAWYCSLIFSALGIILAAFTLFVRPRVGQLVSLMIDLAMVYLLMQPQVQQYFAKGLPRFRTEGAASTTNATRSS